MPSSVDGEVPEQRIVEAAAILPNFGGVTGWAGLRWEGGIWFDGLTPDGQSRLPITLATGYSDVRRQPGIEISQERLGQPDLTICDGLRVTLAVRSICFEMRYAASKREAAVQLDMAAYSDLVSIERSRFYALAYSGSTGIPQLPRRPRRSRTRTAGRPGRRGIATSIWVLDDQASRDRCATFPSSTGSDSTSAPQTCSTPWPASWVEYDGALHLEHSQRRRDRDREAGVPTRRSRVLHR